MRRSSLFALLALLLAAFALTAASCGGDDDDGEDGGGAAPAGEVEQLPASSCRALEYDGEGEPELLIVSDFPRQGAARAQTDQMTQAIRFVLEQRNWQAGEFNIAYQDCDDATAQAGAYEPAKCSQNARAYARNDSLVTVIGTYNSGCMQVINPIINQAAGGPIPMVSPANTLTCLTEDIPACPADEPDKYYPTGTRNYLRVVAHDSYQGAAMATFVQEQGVKRIYVLNDGTPYGTGVAQNFRNAVESLGVTVVGFSKWDSRASSYEALMQGIKRRNPDGIFLGGVLELNGGKLMKDKVEVLGSNEEVKLFAPDGFFQGATFEEAGPDAANGGFYSIGGVSVENLKGEGKEFVDAFRQELGGRAVDPYAAYAAQAATIVLDAIDRSNGTRSQILENLFNTEVENGILGSFTFNENGDPVSTGTEIAATQSFVIAQGVNGEFKTVKEFAPKPELVDVARGA